MNTNTLTQDNENLHKAARALFWQGWSVSAIAGYMDIPRSTIESWKQREHWDDARPIDRVVPRA